jgi:hypothetical protein
VACSTFNGDLIGLLKTPLEDIKYDPAHEHRKVSEASNIIFEKVLNIKEGGVSPQ